MEYKSPLTQYVIEPFDSYLESKNNLNCDNIALLQISFVLMTLSFYYFNENMNDRSGLLYLGSFILFYKFLKKLDNNDIKLISELGYFLINCILVVFIINNKKYNDNYLAIIGIVILLTFISFILKLDTTIKYNSPKLAQINNIFKITANNIYPNDKKTKQYHMHKFWRVFDLSTLSFITFLFLSATR